MKIHFLLILLIVRGCQVAGAQNSDSLQFESFFQKTDQLKSQPEKFDSALYYADRMLREAHTPYQKGLANLAKGNVIGSNDWDYNTGEFAFPYLVKAIDALAQVKAREKLHHALVGFALCYDRKYNPNNEKTSSKSLFYMSMALRLQHDWTYEVSIPFKATFDDRPATRQELQEAINVTKANLAFWEGGPSLPLQMWRNHSLGNLYWHLTHQLAYSEPYLTKAATIARKIKDRLFWSICFSTLTVFSNQSKDYKKALLYGEQGLAHALDTLKSSIRESFFRDQLHVTYKALGQTEKALMHKEKSLQIAEKVNHEAESKRLTFMRERNNELQKRVELEQKLSEQQQRQQWYITGLLGLIALIGYIFYNNYRLRQKNREITQALLLGQTTERKRLAADLHDNLGSTMSSLRWSLGAIDAQKLTPQEQEVYHHVQSTIEQAYDQVRLLSHNLLPEELEKQGLWVTLEQLVRNLNRNTPVKFSLQLPDNPPKLDSRTAFELYSICQELTNNILKHAHATEASIVFEPKNHALKLFINDNGQGLQNNPHHGMGISNVMTRVKTLGGKWEMKNGQTGGITTQIELAI